MSLLSVTTVIVHNTGCNSSDILVKMTAFPMGVSEWLNLTAFLGTEDSKVHIVHISHVIITDTLESLYSLT